MCNPKTNCNNCNTATNKKFEKSCPKIRRPQCRCRIFALDFETHRPMKERKTLHAEKANTPRCKSRHSTLTLPTLHRVFQTHPIHNPQSLIRSARSHFPMGFSLPRSASLRPSVSRRKTNFIGCKEQLLSTEKRKSRAIILNYSPCRHIYRDFCVSLHLYSMINNTTQ